MAETAYPRLFSPIDVGGVTLRNRIVHLATLTQLAERNGVTDALIAYHAARAAGGTAMTIVEGLAVHASSVPLRTVVTIFEDRNLDGLERLAAAGEDRGCRMLGQLWHVGRQQLWNPIDSPVGVSDQPDALSWTVPHVLSTAEVRALIDAFVDSARRLQGCGFSGVELHGAHGYLMTQFLSPWSNSRDDEYGGDRAGRLRFVTEIVDGIRAACGRGFVVGLKMPAREGVPGGIDLDEAVALTEALVAHGGLDYLAYSQGNFSLSLEDHTPDMHYPPGPFLDLHARLRQSAGGVPVMAIGRVRDPDHAEAVLANGQGDLIGLGRPLVADPALALKTQQGRAAEIRPCVFCNLCWGEIHAGKPILCFANPRLAQPDEADWRPTPAKAKRKVVVVGAGPAGLEAAWVAAARGHTVTLFGGAPGGKLRLDALLPGRGEMAKVTAEQMARAERFGVDLRLGQAIDADGVAALAPERVILATGADQRLPQTLQTDQPVRGWRDLVEDLAGDAAPRAGTAVLYDMDHSDPTYGFADLLAQRYAKLVLLTPRVQLARAVPHVNALGIYRRLYAAQAEIVTAAQLIGYADGTVTYANPFNGAEGRVEGVTLLTYSTPRRADDRLAAPLRERGLDVRVIGDAQAPRTLFAAMHEGVQAALQV